MPPDETLNDRVRAALAGQSGISEKAMMGGMCFFLDGNMLGGALRHGDGIGRFMFRLGKDREMAALRDPRAEPVIHGTRRLVGFVRVNAFECDDQSHQGWIALCLAHAAALPPKR